MAKGITEFESMRIFAEQLTADDWKQIVATAIEAAKAGDAEARAWVGLYAMGRPQAIPCRLGGIDLAERSEESSNELLSGLYPAKKAKRAAK